MCELLELTISEAGSLGEEEEDLEETQVSGPIIAEEALLLFAGFLEESVEWHRKTTKRILIIGVLPIT